ncbi:MAG: hypothetical protein WAN93_10815 [Solirubrobacteraceae bacterium]
MNNALKVVVMDGDQTGQELLEQALLVLSPEALGLELEIERYDLSLESRRQTNNRVVEDAAQAMRSAGYGLRPRRSPQRAPRMSARPIASCASR